MISGIATYRNACAEQAAREAIAQRNYYAVLRERYLKTLVFKCGPWRFSGDGQPLPSPSAGLQPLHSPKAPPTA